MPVWACSVEQIPWKTAYGHRHADLVSLAQDHGFFFDPHRAAADVEALLKLLQFAPDVPGAPTYLAELIADCRRPAWALAADEASYEARGELRDRGYRWDAAARHWWLALDERRLDAEVAALRELCERYGGGRPIRAEIPPARRFDRKFEPDWKPC